MNVGHILNKSEICVASSHILYAKAQIYKYYI